MYYKLRYTQDLVECPGALSPLEYARAVNRGERRPDYKVHLVGPDGSIVWQSGESQRYGAKNVLAEV